MPSVELQAVAEAVRADRTFWRNLVDEVGRERMDEPGPMGEWSFKDLTAHLAAWRNCRIPMIEAIARGEPVPGTPWPAGMTDDDEINAWFQARDSRRTLDDILETTTAPSSGSPSRSRPCPRTSPGTRTPSPGRRATS
jgi:hypothetical protein